MFCGMPFRVQGQAASEAFILPDARAGETYHINIESVLRDKYRLRLESDTRSPLFRWTLKDGELPAGLVLRSNGIVTDTPRVARTQPYNFHVKVINVDAPGEEALILSLSLTVNVARLQMYGRGKRRKLKSISRKGNED
jgi:hypothetical protein